MEVVAIDLGGTHVRFAIARVEGGHVASLSPPCTLETGAHPSLAQAWPSPWPVRSTARCCK
jgi:glucokinase